jgi:hypothetical protein
MLFPFQDLLQTNIIGCSFSASGSSSSSFSYVVWFGSVSSFKLLFDGPVSYVKFMYYDLYSLGTNKE